MKRVSFIVPTYNRANLIRDSLEAIGTALTGDDELIIVNDGSTDDTLEVIAASNVPYRYLEQPNAGKAAALNLGIKAARGEFIWICDDDDLLIAESVEHLVGALRQSPDLSWVFGRYERFCDLGFEQVRLESGYWPDLSCGSLARHVLEDLFVMPNAMLVRRTAYQAIGGYLPALRRSEDYDMAIRLVLSTHGRFVDQVVYRQREHGGPRGSPGDLRPASQSVEGWREYDRKIFERLRAVLPLAVYESFFDASPELRRRSALLQRGCVEARHDRWEAALVDWEAACQVSERRLDAGEGAICRRVFESKHGLGEGFNEVAIRRLRELRRQTRLGRSITDEMLRGTAWRLRSRNRVVRTDARRLFTNILGPFETLAVLARFSFQRSDTRRPRVKEVMSPGLFNVKALSLTTPYPPRQRAD